MMSTVYTGEVSARFKDSCFGLFYAAEAWRVLVLNGFRFLGPRALY